jgi:hypothetical protein
MNRPANLRELIELAKGTRYESVAGDERKLEQLFLEELKRSPEPLTREIASGIADGSMTWRTVATSSAYAEYIGQSVAAMREFDLAGALGALAEQDEPAEKSAERPRREVSDEDDLFTGDLLKKRRPR